MAIRPFRYGTDSGLTDLTIDIYDVNDIIVSTAGMPESQISGVYRADINMTAAMEWGIVSSISASIQFIFRLPYNEVSDEIADTILARTEFVSVANNVAEIHGIELGKWQILNNQMIFFKSDNTTEIARFNLFDAAGQPSEAQVFKREKV